ncbi:hypothetical protein CCL21_09370 [Pseudomonas syringae]|uniref:hypothetical protein n=1 Tax=Pseudomonas syringae TaxID=317 RepID=UPI000BB5DFD6|nr:hypothetical protein [Pseudomonas syringae]PBP71010.1 hypothetical protein CCL21_09370 [Pseudomonas syringae]
MKLLCTYEDREEAEAAAEKLLGTKRLASERDSTTVIYNLFGVPNWGNFHRLGMYQLCELKKLLSHRASWGALELARHKEIIGALGLASKNHDLIIPDHWL